MTLYRLYFLDGRTGRIERFEEFEAEDDDRAVDLIDTRIGAQPLELWSGGRRIGRFEAAVASCTPATAGLWQQRQSTDGLKRTIVS